MRLKLVVPPGLFPSGFELLPALTILVATMKLDHLLDVLRYALNPCLNALLLHVPPGAPLDVFYKHARLGRTAESSN
jgi:hypothetical protein